MVVFSNVMRCVSCLGLMDCYSRLVKCLAVLSGLFSSAPILEWATGGCESVVTHSENLKIT